MKLKSKQITIEPSNICTSNCIMCPREEFKQTAEFMNTNTFKKIVNEAKKSNVELFEMCGFGEPFLNNAFFKLADMAKEEIPNIKIYTTSNGSVPININFLNEYIDIIKFSFYGMTEETYKKVHRGNLSFLKSLRNILSVMDNKKEYVHTILQYVLLDENKEELDLWIEFWKSIADEIIIWKPHNWLYKNYRIIDKTKQKTCGRPFNGPPYIHANGDVSICCWDINKELLIGNIKRESLDQIYNSSKFKEIQLRHHVGDFKGLICENCCQTNKDESALIYSSTNRKVGELTSDKRNLEI